ncbi:hypothetical protein [Bizionia arctica]|uniref:Uncharacterized protein n=1 Tax=Bizionia arctica TaxID=1495645 RepID=A0A917GN07_9FLAO|nr:hypothetical protein [Bizionia arctica]GGG51802.1 hypothetical protein GCM10010976_23710 [Bizionia arctica]
MTSIILHIKNRLEPVFQEQGLLISDKSIEWEAIYKGFLMYISDPKPLYQELYRMKLKNPEHVISQLDNLYDAFMTDLAEDFVLGKNNKSIIGLLGKEDSILDNKIIALQQLKAVITKTERQRIIQDLDEMGQRAAFVIAESTLETALKKKARTDLKEQFSAWDAELKEVKVEEPMHELESKIYQKKMLGSSKTLELDTEENSRNSRVISLSWIKYAVAASVLIMAGIFYFKSFDRTDNIDHVLANVETTTQTVSIIENQGMGYISNEKDQQVELIFNDYTKRIVSIKDILNEDTYENDSFYKNELDSLKLLENTYVFDENQLTLNLENTNQKFHFIHFNDAGFYLKIDDSFYHVINTNSPVKLVVENDDTIVEQLEKIIFEND